MKSPGLPDCFHIVRCNSGNFGNWWISGSTTHIWFPNTHPRTPNTMLDSPYSMYLFSTLRYKEYQELSPANQPWQGWANYGPWAACGLRDHFMRPAGTCRNSYACRIHLWNIYYFRFCFYYFRLCYEKGQDKTVLNRFLCTVQPY